jgi:hypothetical protein
MAPSWNVRNTKLPNFFLIFLTPHSHYIVYGNSSLMVAESTVSNIFQGSNNVLLVQSIPALYRHVASAGNLVFMSSYNVSTRSQQISISSRADQTFHNLVISDAVLPLATCGLSSSNVSNSPIHALELPDQKYVLQMTSQRGPELVFLTYNGSAVTRSTTVSLNDDSNAITSAGSISSVQLITKLNATTSLVVVHPTSPGSPKRLAIAKMSNPNADTEIRLVFIPSEACGGNFTIGHTSSTSPDASFAILAIKFGQKRYYHIYKLDLLSATLSSALNTLASGDLILDAASLDYLEQERMPLPIIFINATNFIVLSTTEARDDAAYIFDRASVISVGQILTTILLPTLAWTWSSQESLLAFPSYNSSILEQQVALLDLSQEILSSKFLPLSFGEAPWLNHTVSVHILPDKTIWAAPLMTATPNADDSMIEILSIVPLADSSVIQFFKRLSGDMQSIFWMRCFDVNVCTENQSPLCSDCFSIRMLSSADRYILIIVDHMSLHVLRHLDAPAQVQTPFESPSFIDLHEIFPDFYVITTIHALFQVHIDKLTPSIKIFGPIWNRNLDIWAIESSQTMVDSYGGRKIIAQATESEPQLGAVPETSSVILLPWTFCFSDLNCDDGLLCRPDFICSSPSSTNPSDICPPPLLPGAICKSGSMVIYGNLTLSNTSVTISARTVIRGSLQIALNSSITFSATSSLAVEGCINLNGAKLDLIVPKMSVGVIQSLDIIKFEGGYCNPNSSFFSSVTVRVDDSKACYKTSSNVTYHERSITVLFSAVESPCNLDQNSDASPAAEIFPISAIIAVTAATIGVIVIMIASITVIWFRKKMMPFWWRRHQIQSSASSHHDDIFRTSF